MDGVSILDMANNLDQCLEISVCGNKKYCTDRHFSIFEYELQCMLHTVVLLFWVTQKCLFRTLYQCRHTQNEMKQ